MPYLFVTEPRDYSDLASGKVLRSQPGYPAFPIRLASEIFQRCLARRAASQLTAPCVVYDPCCGAGYLLSVIALLHGEAIQTVIASDIDAQAVSLAERNLDLLNELGLITRTDLGQGRVEYELHLHPHHHHLVCRHCGAVTQVDHTSFEPLEKRLKQKYGFAADLDHFAIFGVCRECQAQQSEEV